MNVKEMKGRFMQLYSIPVNSAVLLTSLFLINTMSREREREEINVPLLFLAAYNETTGLWPSRVCRQPNELSGIHTDVALSPSKGADVDFGGINELD